MRNIPHFIYFTPKGTNEIKYVTYPILGWLVDPVDGSIPTFGTYCLNEKLSGYSETENKHIKRIIFMKGV